MAGSVGLRETLDVRQGQTCTVSLTVNDEAGAPVNLTGATFAASILSPSATGGPETLVVAMAATIINAATGRVDVVLTPAQTLALMGSGTVVNGASTYEWLVKMTDTASRTVPLVSGPVRVWGGL